MKLVRLIMVVGVLVMPTFSQTPTLPDDEDVQWWNDITLTVPIEKKVDFVTKLTLRTGDNLTRLRDGRFQIGFAWKPTAALQIMPFYWYINARNLAGQFRVENRLNLAVTYRFPTKRFGLSHRSTFEKRLRSPVNTWRYRAMMTFEKEIPKTIISGAKWFIADEVFYDSATSKFSRNRFAAGIQKTLTKQLSLDLYYMRQNDGFARPGDLHVIWSSWRIRL